MTTALFADKAKRTVRGLLLPFGELSSPSISNTAPIMFSAGTVEIPTDPSVVSLNSNHSMFSNMGRAVEIVETPEGIVAEFAVANTAEGDEFLDRALDPKPENKPRLSAELANLARRGTQAVRAKLTGAAAVKAGAFQSAAMFSAVDDAVEVLDEEEPEKELDAEARDALVSDVTAAVLDAIATTTDNPETPEEEAPNMTASARAPRGLHTASTPTDSTTAAGLFAAIATASRTKDGTALTAYLDGEAAFASSPINHAGPSGATIGADIGVPKYIGELWTRRKYQRRFWDLFSTAPLDSFEVKGWRFVEGKSPVMAAYTGNGTAVPSNPVDTEPVSVGARRIAGTHLIDRRFTDFPDQGFWQAYFDAMTESYARVSDLDALATAVTAATATEAGTVPADVAPALAAVVDGALAVIATENSPTFAVVSPELWRDIVLTGRDEILGYLSASFGLEEGSAAGFKIIPGPVGTGKVLVGAKEARTVYELGGGAPIRVEGLLPSSGQIEPALYGYMADLTHNGKALALVDTAATGG